MKLFLRRWLHALLSLVLRLRSRPLANEPFAHTVILAPHPDDEAFGCAGLIQTRRAAGLRVSVVYLTDGAGSHRDHPSLHPVDVAQLRRAEATCAMAMLHVSSSDLHFLDAPDGNLGHLAPTEVETLARLLAVAFTRIESAELFLPCRDDGSSEHVAAFDLAERALKIAGLTPRILEYPIWSRWSPRLMLKAAVRSQRVWRLTFPAAHLLKPAVLAAYASQTKPSLPWTRSVLPAGFVECFAVADEYFFERQLPSG